MVELPQPSSPTSIISGNYAGKLTNGLVNLISNINSSYYNGGIDVNEYVKVTGSTTVNVRQQPSTASSIITSLAQNTVITRTKRNVANANGLIWDQIILNNGTIGYIATNYLTLVEEDTSYEPNSIHEDIKTIKAYLKYNTLYYMDTIDNQYDNTLISALEEYQKANNLSNISGLITVETLTSMGFAVDNNGQIVHDTFYTQYNNVAYTYINQPFHSFPNSSNNNIKIYFGNQKSELDDEYKELRNTENSKYNSLTAEEKTQKAETMQETEQKIDYIINKFGNQYSRAALALQNYRNNTGLELNFGETDSIYTISNQINERNFQIEKFMEAAEIFIDLNTINNVKLYREYCYASTIGLGIGDTRLDWYAAANSFTVGVSGNAWKTSTNYGMLLDFSFRDYYDWGEDTFYFPSIPIISIDEEDLRDLHYAGRARNFESTGINHQVLIVWSEGDTIDDATISVIN